jgi:hypothetical protein
MHVPLDPSTHFIKVHVNIARLFSVTLFSSENIYNTQFNCPTLAMTTVEVAVADDNEHLIQSSDPEHPANLICELCRGFYTLGWVGPIHSRPSTIPSSDRTITPQRTLQ